MKCVFFYRMIPKQAGSVEMSLKRIEMKTLPRHISLVSKSQDHLVRHTNGSSFKSTMPRHQVKALHTDSTLLAWHCQALMRWSHFVEAKQPLRRMLRTSHRDPPRMCRPDPQGDQDDCHSNRNDQSTARTTVSPWRRRETVSTQTRLICEKRTS